MPMNNTHMAASMLKNGTYDAEGAANVESVVQLRAPKGSIRFEELQLV